MRSAAEPVRDVTVPALILPVVLPSTVLRTEAVVDASVKTTASSPNPVIPDAA